MESTNDEGLIEPEAEKKEAPATESEIQEIITEATEIREQLQKSNSLPRKFFSAIVTGFGTVIGATILVAITIYIISLFPHVGFLGQFNDWIVDTIKNRGR